jgi:hypothetical protein
MNFPIQDEIIKRAIDFFGLRGVLPHDYEATVLPIVSIGDLGQRTLSLQSGASFTQPFPLVPSGKVWRPIAFSGRVNQSGGVAAIVLQWTIQGLGNVGMQIPYFMSPSNASDLSGEQIKRTFTLNIATDIFVRFHRDLLIPAGGTFAPILFAGDGTITLSTGSMLLVHELGEGLVALQ